MSPAQRQKLVSVLGMLGSAHDGERAAAGLLATRLVAAGGMTWGELLRPTPAEKTMPELGTWRQTVAKCLERRGSLRKWEIGFLTDLPGFRRLSTKQRYVLKEIAARVLDGATP